MSFLQSTYSRTDFVEFLKNDFLPDYTPDIRPVDTPDTSLLRSIEKLGDSPKLGITIFEAVCDDEDRGKRVAITQAAFRALRNTATRNALVAFYSNESDEWRLSLLTSTLELDKNGKIISKPSNPRRFSYLLGNNAKIATPTKYLLREGRVEDFDALQKRFSVEVVNKQFYNSVAELFTKLVGGKRKKGSGFVSYPGLLKIKGEVNQSLEHQEFAVRLIGRLVFCWFLREKRSNKGVSLIPDIILSAEAAKQRAYYHTALEPLFFELLNQKQTLRKEAFRDAPYTLIPYLNGGLFSPQKGDGGDYYAWNETAGSGTAGMVDVPDEWLCEFTELLDTYNFTVDENTSFDIELSVDPEMLGRIFENLLAEINPETGESARKSTGSFYTPREVVDYMVDRSLVYFLEVKTRIDTVKLEALVSYDKDDDLLYPLDELEKRSVIGALAKLTVLDPACGSGAYPIGVLQKVVYVLQQVDKYAKYWLEKQLSGVSPELKRHLEEQYQNQNYDYLRKLGVIRESIFGVDIQPIATEIARLRCFLTLIVEEAVEDTADNRGIQALPNLDFKFVTANSLISLPKDKEKAKSQGALFEDVSHIEELRSIRDRYFGANSDERAQLQIEFGNLQRQMLIKSVDEYRGSASKLYDTLMRWEPFGHKLVNWFDPEWMFGTDKFDIVIANPPYLGEKGHKELFRQIKDDGLGEFYLGKMDLFYFFFHHALNINKDDGVTAFISTNYYPTATGAKKFRKDLENRATIRELINFNELKIFESALGQHNIITILKRGKEDLNAKVVSTDRKGYLGNNIITSIVDGDDMQTYYATVPQNKLYDENGLIILRPSMEDSPLDKLPATTQKLSSIAEIKTGIQAGAYTVTQGHLEKFQLDAHKGTGIFSLKEEEIGNLSLSVDEHQAIVKPFYKNSDILRYTTNQIPKKYLLYVTKDIDIDSFPQIKQHLERFILPLQEKREFKNGRLPWYSLQWARKPSLFEGEKIVVPIRSKTNTFGYNDESWYAATDVNFIKITDDRMSYFLLLGILNSSIIHKWLVVKGKHKGSMMELIGEPLSNIPIPKQENISPTVRCEIERLVKDIVDLKRSNSEHDTRHIELEIDRLVNQLYDLSEEDVAILGL